ncbi:DMT family transporter [Pseudosulfitobacter pseudonitzschiae]|uniref:DMT family transporter n=1 Tax=Pseudosulfitobacter pseudonitzschiae TaxID=1402135 RepID=UPI001AFAB173|nr:DMT family transporter [Pseudosulfitobacter pseudonitzschiae]MBM1813749.1 DMT family transporter [Pseudosulfitobacter pseudonitzschiae]MBM1830742.1 DMT family transporter [Pseudosulfitobacter pseudonitzschiae]MBM1835609.1 DMT family transporter [Pseudosulfitobacter pseudonitzschiae]MBM1840455.1 DMT family transporter [Pseudosulfitobacter pseudonitzschiae]MBM1845557.1 DMT family transporter [Pseudosulfitobacter pseudonitzschiae]
MDQDRPLLGIMLMLGFCIVAPMGDSLAKVIGQSLSLGQLLWCRFLVQVLVLIPLVWLTGRHWKMRGRVLRLTFIRTLLHIAGIGGMFTALRYLPLADAVAIAFVMPFIMLLLGKFVLGEEVGPRRLIACAVGFCGTMLVVQPSFANVGWPALWPLFVAVTFALFMLVTRQIAKETDPVGLQMVSGAMAIAIMSPLLWLFSDDVAGLAMRMPDGREALLLIGIGLFGTLAHLMMTWSLRFAPSATLAPMQYLEIPFATAIGYVVFRDLPNGLATVGIVITIAAGLYVVLREHSVARRQMRVPPTA